MSRNIFAHINTNNRSGYLIATDQASVGCRELPHDLARTIDAALKKGEEVNEVSTGLDGDWFLRTNARRAWKTDFGQTKKFSNVELFARLAERSNMGVGPQAVQSFVFVPDSTGYVVILQDRDSSFRCMWRNVPTKLDKLLEREAPKGIRHVAVGANDSYVIILKNESVLWSGVPESLGQQLDDANRTGRVVASVSLSLISPSWYFVEFADGATKYDLPQEWHASIDKYVNRATRNVGPKRLAPSPVQNSAPLAQSADSEPFNPGSGQVSHFGPVPVGPNQHSAPVSSGSLHLHVTNNVNTEPSKPEPSTKSSKFSIDKFLVRVLNVVTEVLTCAKAAKDLKSDSNNDSGTH